MQNPNPSLLATTLLLAGPLSGGELGLTPNGTASVNGNGNQDGDYLKAPTSAGSPWEITAAASLGLAQGNADAFNYALQGLATYEGEVYQGLIGVDYLYSENNGEATADSLRIFAEGQRLLTDRLYLGLAGSYFTDNESDLDFRFDIAAVLGYHVIKNDLTKLSFEVGPGFAWEDQGGLSENFATLRFAQRFEHQINSRSKLWQSAVVTPRVEDFGDYFLTLDAGIDIRITDQWSARTSLRYLYDSTPAAGQGEDDFTLLLGVAYALGGLPDDDAETARKSLFPGDEVTAEPLLGWTTTAALGLSLAKGNSDSLQATATVDSAYRQAKRELFLNGSYTFGEDDGETSADALRASVQYNRLLSSRLFLGASTSYLRDELAAVDYRLTPAATLGYYLIKNEDLTLSLEGGPAFVFEEVDGQRDSYFALRAAERLTWNLGPRLSLNQALVIDAEAGDFENSLLTFSASIDAKVAQNLAWRLAATYVYDNEPADGLEEGDLTLTSGIAYKF